MDTEKQGKKTVAVAADSKQWADNPNNNNP
jgi:hypothetical protein